MSMGEDVSRFIAKLPSLTPTIKEESKSFLQHIQLFYIEAAKQIKQRFPIIIDDNILKSLHILNPSTINSTSAVRLFPNIISEDEVERIDSPIYGTSSEHRRDVIAFCQSNDRYFKRIPIPYCLQINDVSVITSPFKC